MSTRTTVLQRFKVAAFSLSLLDLSVVATFQSHHYRAARTIMTSNACFSHSFHDFLQTLKQEPTNHIVIGNTAGDADSIVSALTHAYVASVKESSPQNKHPLFLTPILPISKQDLEATRPETLLLLKWAEVATHDLLYVDDTRAHAKATQATLVDHNHLRVADFDHCRVVEIIDHHKDDKMHIDSCQRRNIAYADGKVLVASTCTLIVEALMIQMDDGSYPIKEVLSPKSLAAISTLLLGVILLDSVNLNKNAGKVTDRDRDAIDFLVKETDWSQSRMPEHTLTDDKTPNLSMVFDALQQAKFDRDFWMSLSVRDALRLDYKSFRDNSFGISSVLISWSDFQKEKDDLIFAMKSFLEENKTSLLIVMFAHQDNGALKRELVIFCSDAAFRERTCNFLVTTDLSLQTIASSHGMLRVFEQGNAKASRKQVAPLIEKFFNDS